MMQSYKRAVLPVVDKRFQYKYTGIIIAIAVTVSMILGAAMLINYWEVVRITDLATQMPEYAGMIDPNLAVRIFDISLALLVLEVVALGIAGLVITHKVCGPVQVMHKHLEVLRAGKYPAPRPLRSGDEFVATFQQLTSVVSMLRSRDIEEAEKIERLIASARQKGMADSEVAMLQRMLDTRRERIRSDESDGLPYKVESVALQRG